MEGGGEGFFLPPPLLLREEKGAADRQAEAGLKIAVHEKGAADRHAGACPAEVRCLAVAAVDVVVRSSDCSIIRSG